MSRRGGGHGLGLFFSAFAQCIVATVSSGSIHWQEDGDYPSQRIFGFVLTISLGSEFRWSGYRSCKQIQSSSAKCFLDGIKLTM